MKLNFTKFILIAVVLGVIIFLITYIYSNRTNIDKELNNQIITKSEMSELKSDVVKSPVSIHFEDGGNPPPSRRVTFRANMIA